MSNDGTTRAGAFAAALTVVLAGDLVGCDSESGPTDPSAGGAGSHATTTTTGVETISTCDPSCVGFHCSDLADFILEVSGSMLAGVLVIDIGNTDYVDGFCFGQWDVVPDVSVPPELGMLTNAELAPDGKVLSLQIALATEPTDGVIVLNGPATGIGSETGSCGRTPVSCTVLKEISVTFNEGEVTIAQHTEEPAIVGRPAVRLALLGSEGTEARLAVQGVPAGSSVTFEVTEGEVRHDGELAYWKLPERPGLYHASVACERGGLIATDAIIVEVKASSRGA